MPSVLLLPSDEYNPAEYKIDVGDPLESIRRVVDQSKRLSTGFDTVDAATGGMRVGSPMLIVGETGTGKSLQALNSMLRWDDAGVPSSYWSLEDDPDMVMLRWIELNGGPPLERVVRSKRLSEEDAALLEGAATKIRSRQASFYDMVGVDWRRLLACMRWSARHGGCRAHVVDHLNNVENEQGIDRVGTLDNMARGMMAFARQEQVFLVLVSQFNRQSKTGREPRRPFLTDIKGSSTLEQLFKLTVLLWRGVEDGEPYGELSKDNLTGKAPLLFRRRFEGCRLTDTKYG